MNNDHTCTIELLIELILDNMELAVDENPPTISWESTGIGPYEFWGQKGFDHGHSYPYAEDCLEVFSVQLPDVSDRLIKWMGRDIVKIEYSSFVDVTIHGKYDDTEVRVPFKVEKINQEGKILHIHLDWDGELEEL